ncbi:hypothetical protein SAMN05421644_1139 [Allochromatium warmingii]|uniref:Uncharacterized protein n=1 Tax=Allochromatium warmingii TaxID=61595 RepID=A0A1H3EGF2_ALLWA|nr:hypothetical protein SAMN05421644_1139 [Allochromatium warmingii]
MRALVVSAGFWIMWFSAQADTTLALPNAIAAPYWICSKIVHCKNPSFG